MRDHVGLPPGVLTCSNPLRSCLCCGHLSHDQVCGRCREQLALVSVRVLELCDQPGGETFNSIYKDLRQVGVSPAVIRAAWLVLQIDGQLAEAKA